MFEKFLKKLRRDWRDHRGQVVIQMVTGLATGLLTVFYMKFKEPVTLIALIGFALIQWKFGRIPQDTETPQEWEKRMKKIFCEEHPHDS